jgi:hypothetical protein
MLLTMVWTLDLNLIKIKKSIHVKINIKMKITNEHVELILKEAKYKSGSSSRLQKAQNTVVKHMNDLTQEWANKAHDVQEDYKLIFEALNICLTKLKELGYTPEIKWGKIDNWNIEEEEIEVEDPQFGASS